MDVGGANLAMARAVRNLGRAGVAAMALSAVDVALWDLKARLLGVSLVDLFGARREEVAVYGSGGFCSYDDGRLRAQLGGWVEEGMTRVKMKVGREPERDRARVKAARAAAGRAELFVDANGAYTRKEALRLGRAFWDEGEVRWFEEPVSSDDLEGLAALGRALPMDVAAGEYGYTPGYFKSHAGGRRGRRLAGGCYEVRRVYGLSRGGGAVRRVWGAAVDTLRAVAARAGGMRGAAGGAHGVVP